MDTFKRSFIILLILASYHFSSLSNDTIFINNISQKIELLKHIYVLEDKSSSLNIHDILNQKSFKLNKDKSLNFGYSLSSYWLRFSVFNQTDTVCNLILSIENSDLNHIELHQVTQNNIKSMVTGEELDFETRDIPHGSFLFRISLNKNEYRNIYVKVNSEGEANYIPIKLHSEKNFFVYNEKNNAIHWLVYGLLIFVVIFNLYLYKSINDKIYLQYSLYVFFGFLFFAVYDGYLAYLIMPELFLKAKTLVISFWVFFLLNFSQIFLETASKSKKFNVFFNVLKIAAILMSVLYFFKYPVFVISLVGLSFIFILAFVSVITGSIRLYNRNYLPSLFFLISFFPTLFGVIIIQLKETGTLPANVIFENAFRVGMMIETMLLTIAVLERFRIQQNEAKSIIELNYKQISGQKKQLESANIELEKLSIVASETDNGVSIYDHNLNIEWCNYAFEKLHEISFMNNINKSNRNIMEFYDTNKQLIENCIISKMPLFLENHKFTKSGREVWMQTTFSPYLDDNGALLKLIAIDSDITKIKKYQFELTLAKEKAEESDKLKSAFLSNMSHEIRTPLNAILGFSELLREINSEEKKEKYITFIRNNGLHLLRIISDIIDISKIESKQMIAYNTKESINRNLIELFGYYDLNKEVISKGIKLILHKSENNELVLCDHSKTRQVLDNLINNAIKFTEQGSIEFGATIVGDKIRYFVKDTGIGISGKDKEKIFERFWQSERGLSRKYEGTGLGLSISKGLIDTLNGKIWVESEQGKGSAFYFEVPYEKAVDEDITEQKTETLNIKNKKILIVEDIADSATLLEEIFEETGAVLSFATTGNDALKMASDEEFHLILMDLRLPDINGFDVTVDILKKKKDVKIIAQTANASDNERQRCLNNGFVAYLTKPVNRTELFNIISSILN